MWLGLDSAVLSASGWDCTTRTEAGGREAVLGLSLRAAAGAAVIARRWVDAGAGPDLGSMSARHGAVRPH